MVIMYLFCTQPCLVTSAAHWLYANCKPVVHVAAEADHHREAHAAGQPLGTDCKVPARAHRQCNQKLLVCQLPVSRSSVVCWNVTAVHPAALCASAALGFQGTAEQLPITPGADDQACACCAALANSIEVPTVQDIPSAAASLTAGA